MASRYLIAVGGTGQHIALAASRLVRANALIGDIQLIALDPDNETPLPQLLKAPTPSMSGANHPLKNGTVRAPFDIEKLGKKTFEELFVDPDHPEEQELFQALFDADEGNIPVHKGMYGTPCVGATVFGDGANSDALQNLLKPLSTASQVFVCGSVVGGTGAGLMHKLVREIQRYYAGELFGIFMLPWFDIEGGGGASAINMAVINRNASHGTKYFYEHTLPMLTASLLVGSSGMRATPVLQRIRVGEGDMTEKPSYLHLVAARALLDLPKAHTANREVKAYGMVHSLTREGWLLDEIWETGLSLRQLLRGLRVQENLLRFITEKKNREKILSYYEGGFWKSPESWKPLDASIVAGRMAAPRSQTITRTPSSSEPGRCHERRIERHDIAAAVAHVGRRRAGREGPVHAGRRQDDPRCLGAQARSVRLQGDPHAVRARRGDAPDPAAHRRGGWPSIRDPVPVSAARDRLGGPAAGARHHRPRPIR
jgi:hypothetical protein